MPRSALPSAAPRRSVAAGFVAALLSTVLPSAHAVGTSLDVQVVDRASGETLTPILHDGEWWIAGRPGARYGVTIANRNGRRTLNVIAIDGVNAMSGATAAWNQSGYVLTPYEHTEIDGWRKNADQVAAFEFTALPDSYAARTGRPADVGVIGVAMFNERPRAKPHASDVQVPARRLAEPVAPVAPAPQSPAPPPPAASEPSSDTAAPSSASRSASAFVERERLGTGHGAIEASSIRFVAFERQRSEPDEIVTIRYDRIENLVARGIVPPSGVDASGRIANPFPANWRFVPDPPVRR